MALSKTAITAQVNTLLADLSNITPVEHRQTMYDLIDKAYDENIDGVSLAGTDLVFTRDGGNGSDIVVDLSSFVQDVSGISTNASAISALQSEQSVQDSAIALNTAKTGITTQQASDITANNSKISYTDAADVAANTAKVGITTSQANAITANTTALDGVQLDGDGAGNQFLANDGSYKTVSGGGGGDMDTSIYDPANKSEQVLTIGDSSSFATSAQGTKADTAIQAGDLSTVATSGSYNDLSNQPTTITAQQASDITANNAKVSYTDAAQVSTNTSDISTIQSEQTTQDSAIALNTAKVSYTDAALVATHTSDISTLDSDKLDSVTTGEPTGSDVVGNAVSLTQAEYDAGTPIATTFYIIK